MSYATPMPAFYLLQPEMKTATFQTGIIWLDDGQSAVRS
jgi:hypothetical protein